MPVQDGVNHLFFSKLLLIKEVVGESHLAENLQGGPLRRAAWTPVGWRQIAIVAIKLIRMRLIITGLS